ncbi:MAG TPA: L,D-transpeptidase [Aggregatilineales bacterium]|nr:L,D-transpeptidase [Anaerolineales bacterium]HRE48317.1 L,D-transpeptidase [Aggregatilineales bacterium]
MVKRLFAVFLLAALILPTIPAAAQDCTAAETLPGCTHGLPTAQYEALLAAINAYPAPKVTPITVNVKEVDGYTFYRVTAGAPLYDAPNGAAVGGAGDGTNFVSLYGVKDGFAKLRDGTWIRITDLTKTFASEFAGVTFDEVPRYPVAWVLQASIPAHIPGGVTRAEWAVVKRYTLVTLYAAVKKGGWTWYLIAPGQWIEQRKIALIDPTRRPQYTPQAGERWIAVDLYEQTAHYYEGDRLVGGTLVSTGLSNTSTPAGSFQIYQRLERTNLRGSMGEADGYSLPAVPYAMFFTGEVGFHAVYWHDGFGFKRSHGCVNLTISDARFLWEWTTPQPQARVIVWDSSKG